MEKISKLLERTETENTTIMDILYNLYFLLGVAQGVEDIKHDRVMTIEESKERMKNIYADYNN